MPLHSITQNDKTAKASSSLKAMFEKKPSWKDFFQVPTKKKKGSPEPSKILGSVTDLAF